MPLGQYNTQTQNQQQGLLLMRFKNIQNISVHNKNVKKLESIWGAVLTDGLLGRPTLWPHVVRRFTKHSRTRPCLGGQSFEF